MSATVDLSCFTLHRSLPSQALPDSVKKSYRKGHWTEFMGRVMKYIGEHTILFAGNSFIHTTRKLLNI